MEFDLSYLLVFHSRTCPYLSFFSTYSVYLSFIHFFAILYKPIFFRSSVIVRAILLVFSFFYLLGFPFPLSSVSIVFLFQHVLFTFLPLFHNSIQPFSSVPVFYLLAFSSPSHWLLSSNVFPFTSCLPFFSLFPIRPFSFFPVSSFFLFY